MPDPKPSKPWHGIRDTIKWNPTDVNADACISYGTCMVGCITSANACPTHTIHFPSILTVFALESQTKVHHAIEDGLISRKEQLEYKELFLTPTV
jgi:ferredoxin